MPHGFAFDETFVVQTAYTQKEPVAARRKPEHCTGMKVHGTSLPLEQSSSGWHTAKK
jgi:hypothetical protein